jgi:serine/threonine protein phosphatase PrpC
MKTLPYQLESFGISDIGLSRGNNEDVWNALAEKSFFALADGMGGHKAGEVAAFLAMQAMCKKIGSLPSCQDTESACQLLREAMSCANTQVFEQSYQNSQYAGMGTTLSCFLIVKDHLIYAHVGDSRLYRYRGKLEQLTEDHSLMVPEDPLMGSKTRHMITRAIGTHPTILPDVGVIPLRPRDLYLLCSDGLSDYVEESKIALVLSSPASLEEMGKKLVEMALKKGGHDNITLLLVKVS